ncbi:MAG: serine/threonine protein kinase, partial [Chloroflexi bacterium]
MTEREDRVGQQLGSYRLVRLLGKGGFAEVYLAEHTNRKSMAAVKVLHTRLAKDNFKDFLNEARSFRLKHPHIIPIIDFGMEDDFPYLVMEYAPNG